MANETNNTVTLSLDEWNRYCADLDHSSDRITELEAETARLRAENAELIGGKDPVELAIGALMKDSIPRTKMTIAVAIAPATPVKKALDKMRRQFNKLVAAGRLREVSPRVWVWVP